MDEGVTKVEEVATESAKKPKGKRSKKKIRGEVRVFDNWCKGCGLCIAFCPQHVFDENEEGHPIVARPEDCIACFWCYLHCPDFAIMVYRLEDSEQ